MVFEKVFPEDKTGDESLYRIWPHAQFDFLQGIYIDYYQTDTREAMYEYKLNIRSKSIY